MYIVGLFTKYRTKQLVRNSTRARIASRKSSNSNAKPTPYFHVLSYFRRHRRSRPHSQAVYAISHMRALCPPAKAPSGNAAFFLYATTAPRNRIPYKILPFYVRYEAVRYSIILEFFAFGQLPAPLFSLVIFCTPIRQVRADILTPSLLRHHTRAHNAYMHHRTNSFIPRLSAPLIFRASARALVSARAHYLYYNIISAFFMHF